MFFHVFTIGKKYRIVNFGSKNAFLCKFLEAKEVCPPKWTDLLKSWVIGERNMSSHWHFAERVFFDYCDAIFITKTFAM